MLLCVAETITLLEGNHSPIKMKKKKKIPTFTRKNKVIKTAREISEKVLLLLLSHFSCVQLCATP